MNVFSHSLVSGSLPILIVFAGLLYEPPAQTSNMCVCFPDSATQIYNCCDVTSYAITVTTPSQSPRCFDFVSCNDSATPCLWYLSMWIRTATHHDFAALHNGTEVFSSPDAGGLSWSYHPVTLDCDTAATEIITCDGQACLEADFACWDCLAHH